MATIKTIINEYTTTQKVTVILDDDTPNRIKLRTRIKDIDVFIACMQHSFDISDRTTMSIYTKYFNRHFCKGANYEK